MVSVHVYVKYFVFLFAFLFSRFFVSFTDESLFALFETAFDSIGLQLSDLPSGVTLHSFANVLAKKVFHARCGAIFRRVSDVLTTKSTVYLREGLKGYSAARYNADHRAGAATSHA